MPMSPRLLRPRQTIHPEAADWANRVRTNGGSVSGTTLTAVDRFVKAIHAAGIRDRFYRLNLFCGNSDGDLAAVRTPLFRGQSLTGTQLGGTTDTNNNFVAGDYAETGASGGLLGGSTRYLTTGLTPAAVPDIATGHLSVYAMTGFGDATVYGLLSSLGPSLSMNFFIEANRDTAGGWRFTGAWGGDSFLRGVTTGSGNGHCLISRNSSTSLTFHRNTTGTALSNNTVAVSPTTTTTQWGVFAHSPASGPFLNVSAARLGGYSIGATMTGSQAAAFYTAMQAFQTALGRQV